MKNIGFCCQDHGSLQCVEIRNKPHVDSIYTAGQVLQIAIPAGVSSGQTLSVTVPDGQQLNFTVPPGVSGGSELQLWYDPVAGTVSPLVWPCLELLPAINPDIQKVQCCWEHGIWRFSAPRACLPLRNVSFIQRLTPLQPLPLGQWQECWLCLESHQYLHFAECLFA